MMVMPVVIYMRRLALVAAVLGLLLSATACATGSQSLASHGMENIPEFEYNAV